MSPSASNPPPQLLAWVSGALQWTLSFLQRPQLQTLRKSQVPPPSLSWESPKTHGNHGIWSPEQD